MGLLVFNAGSTSLKFALFDIAGTAPAPLARGSIAPLDQHGVLRLRHGAEETQQALPVTDLRAAVHACRDSLARALPVVSRIEMLAHRVVYGEPAMGEVLRLDAALVQRLAGFGFVAPLHQQAAIEVMRAAAAAFGADLPAFAALDTGFFAQLPAAAHTYALPAELRQRLGIRRSGFHGFAHRSMLERYCAAAGRPIETARVISFQLGGGCSAAAIAGGRPRDTSMGYTPLEGLVMDTRCGDLDAGAVFAGLRAGISAEALYDLLERGSGLLGLAGVSDLRRLLPAASAGDAAAELAVEVYCHRARKYLGAYLALLGGADAVVFGGGVGEHQPDIRARICAGQQWCGLLLDVAANRQTVQSEPLRISAGGSAIAAYVVPVDEEAVIAREVLHLARQQ